MKKITQFDKPTLKSLKQEETMKLSTMQITGLTKLRTLSCMGGVSLCERGVEPSPFWSRLANKKLVSIRGKEAGKYASYAVRLTKRGEAAVAIASGMTRANFKTAVLKWAGVENAAAA